jgi:MATE family multidrug resistance protein
VFGELGYVVVMVYTCFFRGLGDMRTPLYVAIFANVANGILDYALIFGNFGFPELGVAGAGTATAIASWSAAGVLFALFRRRSISERYHTRPIAPDAAQIQRLLRTSAPIGGQWFIGMASFAVFTTLVARMGDESMATSQAFVMLLSLSYMQAVGISIAASTLVGRHIGAEDPDSAMRAYHSALKLGMGLALLIAILFIAIPAPLLRIFTDDPEIAVHRCCNHHLGGFPARRWRHALDLCSGICPRLGAPHPGGISLGRRSRGRPNGCVVRRLVSHHGAGRDAHLALPLQSMAADSNLTHRFP